MFYYTHNNIVLEQQEAYWKKHFGEVPLRLELPLDNPRPPVNSFLRSEVSLDLDSLNSDQIFSFCRDKQLTPCQVLLSAFALLLFRYTGQEEIVFGTAVCALNGFRQGPAPFINPIPLKLFLSSNMSISDLLEKLRDNSEEACLNSMVPFDQISSYGISSKTTGQDTPFIQNFLIADNVLADHSEKVDQQAIFDALAEYISLSDLFVIASSRDDKVVLKADYNSELFYPDTVQRFLEHFDLLLKNMMDHFDVPLACIPMMAKNEYQQTLLSSKVDSRYYPPLQCLHQLFEDQAKKTPDAVAAVFENDQLSYRDLNCRANRLAHFLSQWDVGPNTLVGLHLDRSLDMVVGILGILKAGGAYLPLDPDYPLERLSYIVNDAELSLIISRKTLSTKISSTGCRIVDLDVDGDKIRAQSSDNPGFISSPDHVAYVIYTSGSTGKPKGTLVSHHNVVRLFQATEAWFGFNEKDVWTLFHSFAFDFSVWELWGALLYGGRLIVIPYFTSRSPEDFYQILLAEGVTVLNQTPSAFRQLMSVEQANGSDKKLKLRYVIFGGEALEPQTLRPWFDNHGDDCPQLINMYGITETTVHVTYRPITKKDLNKTAHSPIGVTIPDLTLHVCDPAVNPLPIGVPGEIYVGGSGVAQGYLNRHELTAERFLPDPFSRQTGARIYKTGDLGRRLSEYDIEYLGRIDQQVKIRGFRIELGEIDATVLQHPQVRESVTILREDEAGSKSLVCYLVLKNESKSFEKDIRNFLKNKLPDYMVPAIFVQLNVLPLTVNGKLDLKALPHPLESRRFLDSDYIPPGNSTEQLVAKIFQGVVKVEKVGIHDNFFELGGDSLLMLQVMHQLRQHLKIKLGIVKFFEYPTVATLAKYLTSTGISSGSMAEIDVRAQKRKNALAQRRKS